MKLKQTILIALLALAAADARAQALTGTLKKIKDTGVLTIGFREASVPFSFIGPSRQPMGYSIDLCLAIVESIKRELGANVDVKYTDVNPQNRIALVLNNVIDLECGQTTNNAERRKQVAFSPTIFVSGTKLMVKSWSKFRSYRDLRGKTVVVAQGTTNEAVIRKVDRRDNLQLKIVPVPENGDALRSVGAGQADAWAGDDIVLFAAAMTARGPTYAVLDQYLSYEPFGIMYRIDPPLDALVQHTFEQMAQSGELGRIYDQWFMRRLPSGQRLGVPMSPELAAVFESLGQPSQ